MRRGKKNKNERPDPFKDEQPTGYHYSRRDRLSMANAPGRRDSGGGIFRRNRTLLIILLDLVIILILGLFLARFLYARVNRADLEGYNVVLRSVRAEGVILATLTITRTASRSAAGQMVYVRFSLERNPEEGDSTYVSGLGPRVRGGESVIRAVIPPSPSSASSDVLYAEIRIGDSRTRLSTGVE
jgi:hypothetical protein